MKKSIFPLIAIMALVAGCTPAKNTPENSSNKTIIQKNFCYEILALNEYGKVIGDSQFDCMQFVENCGNDFQSAYKHLEPEIEQWMERLRKDEENSDLWNASLLEVRQTNCTVRNTPNSDLQFTSIDFFMYNKKPYDAYIIKMFYKVIDSEGNVYVRLFGDD